jgi:hypothetical protein
MPLLARVLVLAVSLAAGCTMPPRVLPPSREPVAGAYRFWSCDKPCAFTEEPGKQTRFTTLVLFEGAGAGACWSGEVPPYAAKAQGASGAWRLDPDGVVRVVLDQRPDQGAVLHLSIQGDAVTGSVETWTCAGGCKQAWYAVDGVRVGKPEQSRCGL